MAEVDFILNKNEQGDFFIFLLDQGTVFIPSIKYTRKKITILTSLSDIEGIIDSDTLGGPIFLPLKKYSPYEFEFNSIEKKEEKYFYIIQRAGTPCISLFPCFYRREYSPPLYTSGVALHYRSYYKGEEKYEIEVPDEVKNLYQLVKKYLKSVCKCFKTKSGKRSYWVGEKAIDEFLSGTAQNILELDMGR